MTDLQTEKVYRILYLAGPSFKNKMKTFQTESLERNTKGYGMSGKKTKSMTLICIYVMNIKIFKINH